MRTSLIFSSALTLVFAAACGNGGGGPPGGGDDDDQPDGGITQNGPGFTIQSPDIEITPGQEITYCYYFRTPNTAPLAIKRWVSEMTPGSHHMIMFATGNQDAGPVNTYDTACGGGNAGGLTGPVWTYAAQTANADLKLPSDDGTGKPLGQDIAPNTAAYFQMHYLNATEQPITVHVKLIAEAHEASVQYTKTAAYVTYDSEINIPKNSTNVVATHTCATPAGAKFWLISTHAHKQAVHTDVKDGTAATGAVVFQSTDWEDPGVASFAAPQFFTFSTNSLTYECTYDNKSGRDIVDGPSATINEMCMATGYFFPADRPRFCLNSIPF